MKLIKLTKKFKAVNDVVAFKWIKSEVTSTSSGIVIPDTIHGFNDQRLGHKYVCEAMSCGPKCNSIKPGNRFLLHEYGKIDQGTQWNVEHVMFCHEKDIQVLLPNNYEGMTLASEITEAMESHFKAEDGEVEVNYKQ
ncbi:MAG: hypothetical protein KKF08_19110 [Gammaproteobacteria bacterium]|nr:hypothetical protein [Gammaproteobacteria bacterium]